MTSHYGACDCCGKEGQELSFSESYGIETWACGECCCDPAPRHFAAAMATARAECERHYDALAIEQTRKWSAADTGEAMPADVMEQIRRSKARMAVISTARADVPYDVVRAAAQQELEKIFAAYEREPVASDPCVKMRAIWGIP